MRKLKTIADEATEAVSALLDYPLRDEQADKVATIIEDTVKKAALEGLTRAVATCDQWPEAEQDTAHKISTAIRLKDIALIANLSSLR